MEKGSRNRMKKSVNGNEMRDALIGAADALFASRAKLNEINVYPVADKDTGENMSATMQAAKNVLLRLDGLSAGDVVTVASKAMMNNAKGNSGLLLSGFFAGMARGLSGFVNIGGKEMARAVLCGVEMSFRSINRPIKGTFLTVAREAADQGAQAARENTYISHVWGHICNEAEAALARTPHALPILAKNGVVDAGAMGLCVVLRGMEAAFSTEDSGDAPVSIVEALRDERFPYCVECVLQRNNMPSAPEKLRTLMGKLGDALVFQDAGDTLKIHLHTADPARVIAEGMTYGTLESAKVENIRFRHTMSDWVAKG